MLLIVEEITADKSFSLWDTTFISLKWEVIPLSCLPMHMRGVLNGLQEGPAQRLRFPNSGVGGKVPASRPFWGRDIGVRVCITRQPGCGLGVQGGAVICPTWPYQI